VNELPVLKVIIDDCKDYGVKSIELVSDPLFEFIVINKDEPT